MGISPQVEGCGNALTCWISLAFVNVGGVWYEWIDAAEEMPVVAAVACHGDTDYTLSYKNNVKSGAYYNAVRWAASKGVVNGYGGTDRFGPNDNVTREQLAVMIANYAKKVRNKTVSGSASGYKEMPDGYKVSSYAKTSMGWCFKKGIMPDHEDSGYIRPQAKVTRAETAVMLYALYKLK